MAASFSNVISAQALQSGDDQAAEFQQKLGSVRIKWEKYEATDRIADQLRVLQFDNSAVNAAVLIGNVGLLRALVEATSSLDGNALRWVLTVLCEALRADSSAFHACEQALYQRMNFYESLMMVVSKEKPDSYSADKAAWLLSAVMAQVPSMFDVDKHVGRLLEKLTEESGPFSSYGFLDAVTNLLKADSYRKAVWANRRVKDCILKVDPKKDSVPVLYKSLFAIWMLSFDDEIAAGLKDFEVAEIVKDTLNHSRVEKVVRICLILLKNFLANKVLCEEIADASMLEAVQQLEVEKWRDLELYDDIRETAQQINVQVQEMTNFDRYMRELASGKLKWGPLHEGKFWAENINKFELNNFQPVKDLFNLMNKSKPIACPTTMAVACRDIGEFVTLHPLGKQKVAELHIKELVMHLMQEHEHDSAYREVRREALLCCQKIMLNKWQDLDKAN